MPLNVAKVPKGTVAQALAHRPVMIGSTANPNPYGVDIRCQDDMDPYFPLIGGIQVLAQDLYHSITSKPGSVPGRPNTIDVRQMLNQGITQSDLQTIQAAMSSVLQDDERVKQAQVTLAFDQATEKLKVNAVIVPLNPQQSAQPFVFIASISAIGSSLLSVTPIGT